MTKPSMRALTLAAFASTFAVAAISPLSASAQSATGDTSSKKIALSNNYAANAWRQSMLKSWETTANDAVKRKLIGSAPAFTTSENQATEQAQQIQNLILQGYNAIVVDAASPSALNGTIKKACGAGVVVVSYDGIVTEPCAYRVTFNFRKMGEAQIDYLAERLGGKGNLLEIRGLAGVSVDGEIHAGILDGLKKHPGLKVVGSVNGDWAQTVAQKAVSGILPTLPKIDGVVTQGGDGFGAAQAFKAANRPLPIIILGNREDELQWWKTQIGTGYKTYSASNPPGAVTVAFWVAQQVLAGKKIPKDIDIVAPILTLDEKQLPGALAKTPQGGVADITFSQEETLRLLDGKK
ncbi:ABC transporter substrate-binding protein [Herbaspirillum lusitanum]|uniref:ABC transporter substrate-binding protein n=1 Tax=Herbaspirillum lusitanum TaxID=213312 RepID=A0ABW9AAM3_9BURK